MYKLFLSMFAVLLFAIISPLNLKAQEYDIIISEIYADQTPSLGLPEAEYVELYNRSVAAIDLINWAFADATSTKAIEANFELKPNAYVILTKASNVDLFTSYGNVIGFSSFPSLNNSNDDLKLINSNGDLIHQVNYKSSWHETDKKDGGWSLEIIDPDNTCEEANNWSSSINPIGGTPGKINSIDGDNTDILAPSIKQVNIINARQVEVVFSEKLEESEILSLDKYIVSDEANTYQISNIKACDATLGDCIIVAFSEDLKDSLPISFAASGLFDCAGNQITNQPFLFTLLATLETGDLLINEILFDPTTNAEDFIELYNNSDKYIDLNTIKVADYGGEVQIKLAENILLQPSQLVAVTENKQALLQQYLPPAEALILEVDQLPNFNQSEDLIIVSSNENVVLDSLVYEQNWHFNLLRETKGISLERVSVAQTTQNKNNWQSAAASSNYATPGYQNSQTYNGNATTIKLIEIENATVSPDNDGFEDYLSILYKTEAPGYTGNIQIFDQRGRFVAHPVKNTLLAESGIIKWDGLSETGQRLPLGIYIVYAEFFDLNGNLQKQKLPIVIAGKL